MLFGRMFQIISGTSKTVSGTQNLERNDPTTAHTNVPTNSVLLGTLFLLPFPVSGIPYSLSIFHNSSLFTLSYALVRSIYPRTSPVCRFAASIPNNLDTRIASCVPHFSVNPNWFAGIKSFSAGLSLLRISRSSN
jgi:hypothetical protein